MTRRTFGLAGFSIAVSGAVREDALRKMELVMGPFPALNRRQPLRIRLGPPEEESLYVRRHVTFEPEPGRTVPAWLLIPKGRGRKPGVLCLHQTTKIGKDEPIGRGPKTNLHYARELAELGWVALAPDYPSFGEYAVDFEKAVYGRGYQSTTMFAIVNHTRAVDVLAGLPQVDANRLAVIGHSLGGHNALFVGAFDPRLKAVATSCGFNSFAKYYNGNLKGWSSVRYMPRIADPYQNDPRKVPFDFDSVLRAIAPRAVFVNAPLGDANFEVSGVRDVISQVRDEFPAGRLEAAYPDAAHDFPGEVRKRAYEFLGSAGNFSTGK